MKTKQQAGWSVLISCFIFGFMLPTLSSAAEQTKLEGLIDIDYPNAEEAKVELNLEGALFTAAANGMKAENPDLAQLLANLKSVKVRIYEAAAFGGKGIDEVLKFYTQQLKKPEWQVMARVNDEDSKVSIYSLTKGDSISGLAILVGNPEELVIVNVAGKIDLTKLPVLAALPGMLGAGLVPGTGFAKGQPDFLIKGLAKGTGTEKPEEEAEASEKSSESSEAEPNFVVKGVVKDAKTGKPIAGAKVSDDGYGPKPYKGATTDSDGKYSYTTWYEEHNIVAKAAGYKPQRITLITKLLGEEKEKTIDFKLEPEDK